MADSSAGGQPEEQALSPAGIFFALGAYAIWGLFPLYFKLLTMVPALEVLAHRVIWSVVFVSLLVSLLRRWEQIVRIFLNRRLLGTMLFSGLAISLNWGIFIWAVAHDRVLESSLGYFISPLVSVVFGFIFLGERLRPWQLFAVGLATAGVLNQTLQLGTFPWVALGLAFSFGVYGLIRKLAPVDAISGQLVETMLLLVAALPYLAWLQATGSGVFGAGDVRLDSYLILAGLATAAPLILFAQAAKRLTLATVGLLQYIVPTSHFVLAVFIFGEPFSLAHGLSFVLIWVALSIYVLKGRPAHSSKV